MTNQLPKLEWQMCEDEATWRAAQTALLRAGPDAPARRTGRSLLRRRWLMGALLAVMLPTFGFAYREVHRADQAMDRVENDVRAAVLAEAWTPKRKAQTVNTTVAPLTGPARRQALLARTSSQADPSTKNAQDLGLEVRNVEVRGEYAMVEVWATRSVKPWLPAPYRQTRFYHETEQGWLRVDPPDLFWQPLDTLQTGRFIFIYGPRDADAVLEAARQVEAMDADIRVELGLPLAEEALTIKVITDILPSMDPTELARMSEGTVLLAPSPALLRLPAHISEGEALLQLVAGLLVERNIDEALAGSSHTCDWTILVMGLRLGLFREHSDLPSLSRDNAENLFQRRLAHGILPRLARYGPDQDACSLNPSTLGSASTGMSDGIVATLVDYAVSTYGRDRLPALIDGMKRYDAWETLIPGVFDVSVAEFEAGWQVYLRKDEN